MKASEKKRKNVYSFRFEAKRKDRKRNEKFCKRNKGKKSTINFALVGSEKFEAKRSEKKFCFFHVSVRNACETDLVSLRFALKRQIFFCETGAP
jgi:hypothetical protein